jgi:ubiquinone/menaquinone biosynthesis C-methylase UbiE
MAPIRHRPLIDRLYRHRARWSARRLLPWIRPGDRVLDIGAGDCRVAELLARRGGCEVVPVDVEDYNTTPMALTLFDGRELPFDDDSFDAVLLLFVLHHAEDVEAVLREACRVCRRSVIVFEDLNLNWLDRLVFRGFHRLLYWSEKIPRPHREWTPDQWQGLARRTGLSARAAEPLGRQLGPLASRHIAFVWEKSACGSLAEAVA